MVNRREIPQANPPFNAPFLDSSGRVSQDWQRWITNMFSRQGGTQDDIWNGLFQGLVSATQINSVTSQLSSVQDQFAAIRSEIAARGDDRQAIVALEDEVATLRSMLAAKITYDDQIKLLQQQLGALQQQNDTITQQQEVAKREAEVSRQTSRAVELQQQQVNYSRQWASVQAINDTDTTISNLTTSSIPEGARLYYTDARARAAISAAGSLSYNNVTGVISYTTPANSATASKWATARTLSFSGDVTGSGSVDGSADVDTTITIGAGKVTSSMLATSIALTGSPTAPTVTQGDNSTAVSTTAFVAFGAFRARTQKVISSNTTLVAADQGAFILVTTGGVVVTVPLASAAGTGASVLMKNVSGSNISLALQGSDATDRSSLTVATGVTVLLFTDGSSFWRSFI